ncbi:MAG: outer membrane lipoprotein chaperone LolA [Buchnera aphidicola (Floraphis choui)]
MYRIISKICKFFLLLLLNYIQISYVLAKNITFENRISKLYNFSSFLKQKTIDETGIVIQSGKGEVQMKKLRWFNWHLINPDQVKIISNLKTIWFYDSLIHQVSIFFAKDIFKDAPFMLFTNTNKYFLKITIF